MNSLFFLIIPILLIPSAYAEVGKNYDTVQNPDGSITWTSAPERILDTNSNWVNYIFTDDVNYLQVETAGASVRLDKNLCEFSFYNSGIIGGKTPILIDDIIPYQSVDGSGVWNKITNLDNAACSTSWNGSDLKAIKTVAGLGTVEYIYKFTGSVWKTELRATNESGLNDRLFGFEQLFNLNSDTINYGGSQRNLDTLDGSEFDRTFLVNNEAKVINLLNGYYFDFDLGFDKLNKVWINDTGVNSSLLTFQYFYAQTILPDGQTLIIDPTFSSDNPSVDGYVEDDDNDDICEAVPASASKDTVSVALSVGVLGSANAVDCRAAFIQWDTSSIPDGSFISDVDFSFEVYNVAAGAQANCDFVELAQDALTASNLDLWTGIQSSGTVFLANDPACTTISTNKSVDLGASADSNLQSLLASDRFTLGIRGNGDLGALDAVYHETYLASEENATPVPKPTLTVVYTISNAVDDLISTEIRATALDLSWTAPVIITGTIQGYQINFTTPWNSNVASIVSGANSTNSTATTYTVTGLIGSTPYSFRVGVWNTLGGINASGNVLNITTTFDPTAAFTAGTFNITAVGVDVRDFKFERTNINSTSILLNITYANTVNATCNFYYKFAMTNNTFTNITDVAISPTEDEASFRFLGVDNEIIDVNCVDENSNATGKFLITQTQFMVLQQIQDFQAGKFGTAGDFGVIDFVALTAIIISMVGFNRVNESVGVVLGMILIGALTVFQIIPWESTFTASVALIVMWAVTTTRKT